MMYEVTIAGIVHSLDPILSPQGYARAVFTQPHNVSVEAVGKKLFFTCRHKVDVNGSDRLEDITAGVLNGDDRNVEWNLEVTPKK